MTEFMEDHPGGSKVVMLYAGKDATDEFSMLHKPAILNNGLSIQVPLFIEAEDEVIVDTRNLEYIKKI